MIDVTNIIKVHNTDEDLTIKIKSSKEYSTSIIFVTPGGMELSLIADDVIEAIKNARNNRR